MRQATPDLGHLSSITGRWKYNVVEVVPVLPLHTENNPIGKNRRVRVDDIIVRPCRVDTRCARIRAVATGIYC